MENMMPSKLTMGRRIVCFKSNVRRGVASRGGRLDRGPEQEWSQPDCVTKLAGHQGRRNEAVWTANWAQLYYVRS